MNTTQERISMLAMYAGNKSMKALASDLGLNTPQMLYDLKSGKTKEISGRLANKIFLVFPEVSQTWLLTGEGEMLTERPRADTFTLTGDALKLFLNLSNTIVRQEENISKLADMVNRLTGGIPKKDTAG